MRARISVKNPGSYQLVLETAHVTEEGTPDETMGYAVQLKMNQRPNDEESKGVSGPGRDDMHVGRGGERRDQRFFKQIEASAGFESRHRVKRGMPAPSKGRAGSNSGTWSNPFAGAGKQAEGVSFWLNEGQGKCSKYLRGPHRVLP